MKNAVKGTFKLRRFPEEEKELPGGKSSGCPRQCGFRGRSRRKSGEARTEGDHKGQPFLGKPQVYTAREEKVQQ